MQNQTLRYYFLDNLKWILAVDVIFFHTLVLGCDHFTSYKRAFIYIIAFNQSFFMSLFFFISAYFVVPSYNKKGKHLFNKDRLIRLGGAVMITIFFIKPIWFQIIPFYNQNTILNNYFHYFVARIFGKTF